MNKVDAVERTVNRMVDVDKVIRGQERCKECNAAPAFGMNQAYIDCEYTIGLYCGQDKLRNETVEVLKSQKEEIERLKENIEQLIPVLHGKWENKSYDGSECYAICSQCGVGSRGIGKRIDFGFKYIFSNYCRNCGAKMEDCENDG